MPHPTHHTPHAAWLGLWSLYAREFRRFWKICIQTVFAPVVTTLLFLTVFSVALGRADTIVSGIPYSEFLAPGLIVMAIIQNAFANTSASIMTAKTQGNIVDTLMSPLTPMDLTVGYAFSGASRGVVVAIVVAASIAPFVELRVHNLGLIVLFAVGAALISSMLGIISGIWSEKHEHNSAMTNFVIMPLSFLSGTFYSIERLPEGYQAIALYNPFFYLIDGFRYAFTGHADGSVDISIAVLIGLNAVLWFICYRMFASGYKLKP